MATGTSGDQGQKFHTNQTHFLVKRVAIGDNVVGTATANPALIVGYLPPRAVVFYGHTYVITGFNDTNGDDFDIGIVGGDDDWFASAVDVNNAVITTFDDLTVTEAYSASARTVTVNFTTAPSGDGTAGEAIIYLEYYVAPASSNSGS